MEKLLRLSGIALLALGLLSGNDAQAEGHGANIHAQPMPDTEIGMFRGRIVRFVTIGGQKVTEGDIILDHVGPLGRAASRQQPNGVSTAGADTLWPQKAGVFVVPYVISGAGTATINSAIARFNAEFKNFIQWKPRAGETDFVNFALTPGGGGGCFSAIGRIGGEQPIQGSGDCPMAAILHEMGHTLGLYHEQSRSDRDSYLAFSPSNVVIGQEFNFAQPTDGQDLGTYDYASLMQYYPYAFSVSDLPTMESKPAGIDFGQATDYSAGDIDGIHRLYGAAPNTVTVASLPAGLKVVVDGVTVTTPHSYAWTLNSKHTLAVPAGAQTVAGQAYTFGRWSDAPLASHTITVKPGNGRPVSPKTAPALTSYLASFIHLVQFNPLVSRPGEGTVTASPAPKAYAGLTGKYFTVRQAVSYTAHPAAGYIFAGWGTQEPSANNPIAGFSTDYVFAYIDPVGTPLTTIATNPAGLGFSVDGGLHSGPALFDWQAGSTHSLGPATYSQNPNAKAVILSWSDHGAVTHNVTATKTSRTITATMKQQFAPSFMADQSCAGTVKLTPAATGGFYDSGATVKVTATPKPGWKFAGWTEDLAGNSAGVSVVVDSAKRATAQFNTVAAPLAVTGFSPATLPAHSAVRTLTINGTGFSPATEAFVNTDYRPPTVLSASKLTIPLKATDVAGAGVLDIQVLNVSGNCGAFYNAALFVTG